MSSGRTIDDAMLSAWLDGELPEPDAREVRAALASDPRLAARLAALQQVDALVKRHAAALDATPLPSGVLAMLQDGSADSARAGNVVQGPWQAWHARKPAYWALAAGLVLALAVALLQLPGLAPRTLPELADYAQQLDTHPSGSSAPVGAATLQTRFSFVDRNGRYCRQYQLSTADAASENVACRDGGRWSLVASLAVAAPAEADSYQPAAASLELEALLDTMMAGAALDLASESELIDANWQSSR